MNNAKEKACEILYKTADEKYTEKIRQFQGCPTVAVTPKGRIYLGWYSGGTREPHMENYNLLVYSDDQGNTWSKPLLIIPSSKERLVHALDIQLWSDPNGILHVFWVQNDTKPAPPEGIPERTPERPIVAHDGYLFDDMIHACWEMTCENPDDEKPIFSEPRYLGGGFLRCKPLVLKNGTLVLFNYDQTKDRYGYSISKDGGKTYERHYGGKKLSTPFDETMAYQRADGSVRMLARTHLGELAESVSFDNCESWTDGQLSGIDSPNTRFFVARTPSGRILLVNNDDREERKNMTLYLSEDEGATWKYQCCIDARSKISYPDVDFYGDQIYLTYDRERTGAKEILFTALTEEDIVAGRIPELRIVSKP
ncbi:MAG: exo-alpha-sialidase [Clostridia bacterium]|nr:exo-alpha-sialidase [Clostridia bacterium]